MTPPDSERNTDVAFVFTEETFAEVAQMEADQRFTGAYGAVIDDALRQLARRGVAEVVMRNPETNKERTVRIPRPVSAPREIHRPFGRAVCRCCGRPL